MIRFQMEWLSCALLFTALWRISSAQNGFLSIDCGSSVPSFTDPRTRLIWENDEKYIETPIQTGEMGTVADLEDIDTTLNDKTVLQSFRYFPGGQRKYCYTLPLANGTAPILIRAMFLHGYADKLRGQHLGLTSSNRRSLEPIRFDVSVNATLWFSVQFNYSDPPEVLNSPKVWEGIFLSPGNALHFCLLPDQGLPFISTLELRPLENSMYDIGNHQQLLLAKSVRWNYGLGNLGTTTGPIVRYPDDKYDRIWEPARNEAYPSISADASLFNNEITNSQANYVPAKVMMDAINMGSEINYDSNTVYAMAAGESFPITIPIPSEIGRGYIYAILYFEDVTAIDSTPASLTVNINGEEQTIDVTKNATAVRFPQIAVGRTPVLSLYLNWNSTTNNNVPIPLNAIEAFEVVVPDFSGIRPEDDDIIEFMKKNFSLSDSEGNPCTPVPYKWLSCEVVPGRSKAPQYGIQSITLSNLDNSTKFLDSASHLSRWTLTSMETMSITNSSVNDRVAEFLLNELIGNEAQPPQLKTVDLSHNSIGIFPNSTIWGNKSLSSINFSHNNLTGAVPSLEGLSTTDLEVLNFSGNFMTVLPNYWLNVTSESQFLTSVRVLDLSHNNISGDLRPLYHLLLQDVYFAIEVNISHNNFKGIFPSDLFLSNLTRPLPIKINFEQNHFEGLLDLTIWYQEAVKNPSSMEEFAWNISLVNNKIEDIKPSAKVIQSLGVPIGILLGGNPYCKGAKSDAQRYLCRYSFDEQISAMKKSSSRWKVITATVLGVALGLLLCAFVFTTIWKLQRQVHILQEFQQALADRQVQPPLFSYNVLKSATRDFHEDNKLGSGAFGAVYKAILPDGTRVAVKRLFDSQKGQVLTDFLNEVVLITGIKHKNLVQLKGCCIRDKERILVYEYAHNGNVAEALWGRKAQAMLDWRIRLNICIGIAKGLSYLHEELQPRIIHRDIKAPNILLDENFNSKIADFGLAKSFMEEQTQVEFTHLAGTTGYFAPEYVLEGQLTNKADVYSFGILLLEIISGRKCIDSSLPPHKKYLKSWAEDLYKSGKLLEILQPELRNDCPQAEVKKAITIAFICLQMDPRLRGSMSEVVTMFMGNVDVERMLQVGRKLEAENDLAFESGVDDTFSDQITRSGSVDNKSDDAHSPLLQVNRILSLPASLRSDRSSKVGSIELKGVGRGAIQKKRI